MVFKMALMEIAKKEKKYGNIFGKLDKLVEEELEKAIDENGEFASSHEGISVLLEEIEEAEDVVKAVKKLYNEAWEGVKNDDYSVQLPIIAKIYLKGLYLAMETIQVTAMAQKYYKYLQEKNPQTGLMNGQLDITAGMTDKVKDIADAEAKK
jgi:rRNA maturation protein Rpf1